MIQFMTKFQLIYPMAFYVFYIFALAVYMFMARLQVLKNRQVSMNYFKTYSGEAGPQDQALVAARHFDNQFQVPVLFLLTCAVHCALDQATYMTLALAWLFVATRIVHSWIHLGANNVRRRAAVYGLGWLVVLAMWIELLLRAVI